jgi:adenylate kinase
VSDEIMIGIVRDRLKAPDADTRGYILDGFPRTIEQAVALDQITTELGKPIDVVLDLNVPREIVLERILARRVCRDCGTNYTASGGPDPTPWICDVCGGDVMQRDDDTPDSVNRRLDIYEEQTFPLIKYYGDQQRLAVVNGVGRPDDVFERLVKAVETNRR